MSFLIKMLFFSALIGAPSQASYWDSLPDEELIPIQVEGVYKAKGPGPDNKIVQFHISILRDLGANSLSVTLANANIGNIFYFSSKVFYKRLSPNTVQVDAYGLAPRGGRQHTILKINTETHKLEGRVEANFFENDQPVRFVGTKTASVMEELAKIGDRNCAPWQNYLGVYKGHFGKREDQELILQELPTGPSSKTLTANIMRPTKIVYHDGQYFPDTEAFEFENRRGYELNGKSRKLYLLCDQDEDEYILIGLHVASSGAIIRDIEFRKPK